VPVREILLSNGEVQRVYDTTGPQGCDLSAGLPKRRAPWIEARIARGDRNFSQMHYARRGEITEEMRFVALRENVSRSSCARDRARARDHPGQQAPPRSSSR
jgi:phosphomethylpyrimidine synthase